MNKHFAILLLSAFAFALLLPTAVGWWNEHCAEGGQCANMIKNYEALVQGEGCRSFYLTGKCTRICTYSLKSLIGRHTWSKCAERCEWSKAITDAASSWLAMCLARPASDVLQKDESEHGKVGIASDSSVNVSSLTTHSMGRGANVRRTVWFCISAFILFLLCSLLLNMPVMSVRLKHSFRRFSDAMKRLLTGNVSDRLGSGKGLLDVGPNRNELRDLQRGARRHLKALRSNLD